MTEKTKSIKIYTADYETLRKRSYNERKSIPLLIAELLQQEKNGEKMSSSLELGEI